MGGEIRRHSQGEDTNNAKQGFDGGSGAKRFSVHADRDLKGANEV